MDFFEDVVGEAEARYSDNAYSFLDPRVRVAKVKEYAQMLMISRLVETKGTGSASSRCSSLWMSSTPVARPIYPSMPCGRKGPHPMGS
jgi:hypothetical protein